MAKSRNNLLGVGGQRGKLSRADRQGRGAAGTADRRAAADQKQELLRRMRERNVSADQPGSAPAASGEAGATTAPAATAGAAGDAAPQD
ncbi:DUF6243 family protein [Streptomyces sp. LP05-1]|uniref:DUF6243 family protein n=1 Tax=Streptomyces pyxinae TaxID=2970734 RepID=A0ABT2CLA7_9ACTN|nr:DUF6243 family protein [Streptomyces sp. LP05-1]MCS0638195.1 DUF6243 family protein [Streptomyces sp. LP05-1]